MEEARSDRRKLRTWLLGCSVALVLTFVLCAGGAWLGFTWLTGFAWDKGIEATLTGLEEAGFTQSELDEFRGHIERLRAGYEDGSVELAEIGELVQDVVDGRILPVALTRHFEHDYVPRAELSPEESARAVIDVQRFARGVWEQTIPTSTWERVFRVHGGDFTVENGESDWERAWRTPEDVRAVLEDVRAEVERVGIPDEPYTVRLGEEFGAMVDELLYD